MKESLPNSSNHMLLLVFILRSYHWHLLMLPDQLMPYGFSHDPVIDHLDKHHLVFILCTRLSTIGNCVINIFNPSIPYNNNNNLILRSRPSETPNWCMRPPCLWDKGPPPPSDLNGKFYEGIHTLPPLDLNL
jgi:hypothetical protein